MTEAGGPTTGASEAHGPTPAFDGLRGAACLIVVCSHLWTIVPDTWLAEHTGPFYGLFKSGSLGVTLFLVLGGFLVTRSLVVHQERAGSIGVLRFWGRRLLRLGPQLSLLVITVLLVSRVDRWDEWSHPTTDRTLAGIATFRFNLGLANGDPAGYRPDLGHLWYLSMEQQVYFVWVAALAWLGRFRLTLMTLLVGSIAACYAWRASTWNALGDAGWWRVSLHTFSRADALLVGCLAGLALPYVRPFIRAARLVTAPALVTLVALVLYSADLDELAYLEGQGIAFVIVAAVLVLAIAVAADEGGIAERVLATRPLRLLGTVSFSVFLWHLPVFWAASRWGSTIDWAPRAVATVAILAGIVTITDRLVERPIGRWLHRPDPLFAAGAATPDPRPMADRSRPAGDTEERRSRRWQPVQSQA
ncbi:acyltransferase family protein [Desertimonas flava]|uniref:acyltransferase family protein n=1 Tax=Desertimonas flava TaxID=2064846 RepID=UPI000E356B10|nr:acyltransferase [Desertimonas flava]